MIRVLLFIVFGCVSIANANERAKQDAQSIVNKVHPNINAAIQGGVNFKGSGDTSIKEIINYQGADIKETAYKDQSAREAALAIKQQVPDDASEIVSASFLRQKEFQIDKNSPIWDNAKQAQAHPERYVDWISGKYEDCKQDGGEALLAKEHKVCDEYREIEERSCVIGRAIVVDAKHNYQCTKSLDKIFKRCTKNLVVSLRQQSCFADVRLTDFNYQASISNGGEYVSLTIPYRFDMQQYQAFGWGGIAIPDIASIESLVLEEISYNSPIQIMFHQAQWPKFEASSFSDDWNSANGIKHGSIITRKINADIKHLLGSGRSYIYVRSVFPGSITFKFRITKQCPVIEEEEWVENCTETKEAL